MTSAAPPLPPLRRYPLFGIAASLVVAGCGAWVLWRFPPDIYRFYPVCPIHTYLHLQCPGCGTTRALAALLHGRFAESLRLNPLAVLVVLPASAVYGAIAACRATRRADLRWPQLPGWAVTTAVAGVVGFTVLRNL